MSPEYPSRRLALFDFDGTLIRKDSFISFALHAVGKKRFLFSLSLMAFHILGWKTGFKDGSKVKEKFFRRLYGGMQLRKFEEKCSEFASVIESNVRSEVRKKMQSHLERGDRVVIVSASIKDWILPWARANGVSEVIATEPETDKGGKTLTGNFKSLNCKGGEKVRRIRSEIPDIENFEIWAYGDSKDDEPLLSLAHHPYKV